MFTYAALCTLHIKASNILQHIQLFMPKIQKMGKDGMWINMASLHH